VFNASTSNLAPDSVHENWSGSCNIDMIIYVRANDSIADIRYFEEYGECVPLDRARKDSDFESVAKSNENDCFNVCNQDWSCYAFHYLTGNCILWKFPGGVKGSKVSIPNPIECHIKFTN
jgi:hypothetical protein